MSRFTGLCGLLLLSIWPIRGIATGSSDLADLSIEELMNEKVTSVSKKAENRFEAAAAISVLSNDDLQRSGATSIADALRMVPGLQVGSLDSGHWAISARGFNNLYSNKLLVLVDGRAVYTPLFSGVYWDLQQMALEDIDRIEVIRGPGATVWGANAVNGVINIVTRSAGDTEGALVSAGAGDPHEAIATARYGGSIGDDTRYRVFGGYRKEGDFRRADGGEAQDHWLGANAGFRLDRSTGANTQVSWQTGVTQSELDDGQTHAYNVNTLGSWTRQREHSAYGAQAYYDRVYRDESGRSRSRVDTIDLGFQHTLDISERNETIWGVGYRFAAIGIDQVTPLVQIRDGHENLHLFSGFIQNEFRVIPDKLALTAGVKLEHNDFTGVEVQPSVRAALTPDSRQTLWSALSRAVRTPSLIEGKDALGITYGAPFTGPDGGQYLPTLVGSEAVEAEVLWSYELGYRVRPADLVSVDVATFYNRYSGQVNLGDPQRFIPGDPIGIAEMPWGNALSARSWGGEVAVAVVPADRWRVVASYSLLRVLFEGSTEADRTTREQSAPRHQAALRSTLDFASYASLDVQMRYVGPIEAVPAYVESDVRLSYQPNEHLELALTGQNLLDSQHPEQASISYSMATEVVRGYYGKLIWRFP